MSKLSILAAALIAATVAGCDEPAPPTAETRPLRTVTVAHHAEGETVSLTGQIRAKDQVGLAFRLDGRMIERPVNVGDVVSAGQVVARLDPQNQQNALRSAQADLTAAEAVLTQARLTFGRQQKLLADGWTTRARFDEAEQALRTARLACGGDTSSQPRTCASTPPIPQAAVVPQSAITASVSFLRRNPQ
jgi:multidrug efflux pump subunit AcrA (membrane-fusion protein)